MRIFTCAYFFIPVGRQLYGRGGITLLIAGWLVRALVFNQLRILYFEYFVNVASGFTGEGGANMVLGGGWDNVLDL